MAIRFTSTVREEGTTGLDGVEPGPRPRRRRWLVRLIRIPLLVYAGVVVVLFAIQTRLIFPGSETQGKPEAVILTSPDAELVTLTTDRGDRVVALFGKALNPDGSPRPDASTCPTLLYFYGNAMCLRDSSEEFGQFRRLGANVLIPEYVGFGMSGADRARPGAARRPRRRSTTSGPAGTWTGAKSSSPGGSWAARWRWTLPPAIRSPGWRHSARSPGWLTCRGCCSRISRHRSCYAIGSRTSRRSRWSIARCSSGTGGMTGRSRSRWPIASPQRRRGRSRGSRSREPTTTISFKRAGNG